MDVVKQVSQVIEHEPAKVSPEPIRTDITEHILNLPTTEGRDRKTQIQHEVAGDVFTYAIETGRNFAKPKCEEASKPGSPAAFTTGLISEFFKVF